MDRQHTQVDNFRGARVRSWRSLLVVGLVVISILCLHIATSTVYTTEPSSLSANSHHRHRSVSPGDRVLITGASGFIGYHLINELVSRGVRDIVGLDSYSTYYPPPYKYQRSWRLSLEHGIDIVNGDVCDEELLSELFRENNFTHIVHLAASANVRFSVEEPHTVLRNNVVCFQVILEQLRNVKEAGLPVPHFVWASSSSVYGLNEKVPFESTDRVDKPASLYGASKRMNEFQALVYNHIFKIPSVGLRFFTVYGPWGRPDMAPYKFTKNICDGKEITVFNEGNMKRDFTYVTDIVKGIVASMEYRSTEFLAFNLGNNKPVALHYFISTIEKLVGKDAKKIYKESNVDLPLTYSSNEITKKHLKWQPTISIEEGMSKFVHWYKNTSIASMPCASECSATRDCYASPYDTAKARSREISSTCSLVIYSIVGVHDTNRADELPKISTDEVASDQRTCYIAFIGKNSLVTRERTGWLVVEVDKFDSDVHQSVRLLPKYNPHGFFADTVKYAIFGGEQNLPRVKTDTQVKEMLQCGEVIAGVGFYAMKNATPLPQLASGTKSSYVGVSQRDAYTKTKNKHSDMLVVDNRNVVHNMKQVDVTEFRCRWANENIIWEVDSDQASLNFALQTTVKKVNESASGVCYEIGSGAQIKTLS